MICQNILDTAISLLGKEITVDDNADYPNRAGYIIPSFACEASEVDKKYRQAYGLPARDDKELVYLEPYDDFPLCPAFASVAAYYLASMLICDEDPELSDKFYDKYCDGISSILEGLPATKESTVNCY